MSLSAGEIMAVVAEGCLFYIDSNDVTAITTIYLKICCTYAGRIVTEEAHDLRVYHYMLVMMWLCCW
jgi:hypothetical protein